MPVIDFPSGRRLRPATGKAPEASDRPTVFIGSSTEGLPIAKYLQLGLARTADCVIWTQGVFGLSQTTIESLIEATKKADFAILVLTPDDLGIKRSAQRNIPRDNVIFELGLFMGTLGRQRTFVVHGTDTRLELPSDLAGLTTATFSVGKSDNLQSGLGPVCTVLEDTIRNRFRGSDPSLANPIRGLLGLWNCTWSFSDGDTISPILDKVRFTAVNDDLSIRASGMNRRFGNYELSGRATPTGVLTLLYQGDSRRYLSGGIVILKLKVRTEELSGFWHEYDADRQLYGGTTVWVKNRGRARRHRQ